MSSAVPGFESDRPSRRRRGARSRRFGGRIRPPAVSRSAGTGRCRSPGWSRRGAGTRRRRPPAPCCVGDRQRETDAPFGASPASSRRAAGPPRRHADGGAAGSSGSARSSRAADRLADRKRRRHFRRAPPSSRTAVTAPPAGRRPPSRRRSHRCEALAVAGSCRTDRPGHRIPIGLRRVLGAGTDVRCVGDAVTSLSALEAGRRSDDRHRPVGRRVTAAPRDRLRRAI